MTKRRRLSPALAAALLTTACGPFVQVILYTEGERLAPREPFCSIDFYKSYDAPPSELVPFGDVFGGDTGWTYFCTELSMQTRIRQEACAAGADAVRLLTTASASSSCRQTRASLLRREEAK